MRILAALLFLATASVPAAAQPRPGPRSGSWRRCAATSRSIIRPSRRLSPASRRRRPGAWLMRASTASCAAAAGAILAAPGASLVAIEARQGALLRALGRQDMRLCAAVGDRGFFSSAAAAAAAPAGLDDYGVALVEAAKAGAGSRPRRPLATKEDFTAWLAAVGKIEPDVPVWRDAARIASFAPKPARTSCAGARPPCTRPSPRSRRPPRERVARTLLRSVIGASAP